jgi:lysophospholipase L1-like esterase
MSTDLPWGDRKLAQLIDSESETSASLVKTINGGTALNRLYGVLSLANRKPRHIVFTGSSTTEGANATAPENRYVNRLVAALQATYPSGLAKGTDVVTLASGFNSAPLFPGIHGFNAGASGAISSNYINATTISQITTLKPSVVIHMVGSNDFAQDISPATVKTNVQSKIAAIDAALTEKPIHIVIYTYQRLDITAPVYPWVDYKAPLKSLTSDNVLFIDSTLPYIAAGIPGTDPYDFIDTDGIHQTNFGHKLMAETILKELRLPAAQPSNFAVYDYFNRPAGGTLGMASNGQLWTPQGAATATIQAGKAKLTAGGTVLVESGLFDLEYSANIVPAANAQSGIVFRAVDDANRLGLFANTTSNAVELFITKAGTTTSLTANGFTFAAGREHELRVKLKGNLVTGFVNGTQVITHTLSAGNEGTGTKIGFRSGAGLDALWDDIAVKPL